MPLEGCLHGRRDWRRLIQGRKESSMVNSLEFCVLVGTDHSAGRLVGRCIVKAESSSPARAAALWMVALILGLVRKFMRTKVRSSKLQGSDGRKQPWSPTITSRAQLPAPHRSQPYCAGSWMAAGPAATATPMLQPQELVMPATAAGG